MSIFNPGVGAGTGFVTEADLAEALAAYPKTSIVNSNLATKVTSGTEAGLSGIVVAGGAGVATFDVATWSTTDPILDLNSGASAAPAVGLRAVLPAGETGLVYDVNGGGWAAGAPGDLLPIIRSDVFNPVETAVDAIGDRNVSGGYAGLDEGSKVDFGVLPVDDSPAPAASTLWSATYTKGLLESSAAGLDVRASARLATAAALPPCVYAPGPAPLGTLTGSAFGALTVDGELVAPGDRIMVKNQVDARENGIYLVDAPGSPSAAFVLSRSPDADGSPVNEVHTGIFAFVNEGTLAGTGFVVYGTPGNITVDDPVLADNGPVNWTRFSTYGAYTAGSGLTLSPGREFAVDSSVLRNTGFTLVSGGANLAGGALQNANISAASGTTIDGARITAGTVADARLPTTLAGKTLTGAAITAAGTNISGDLITSGTVADARLPTTMAGKTFSSALSIPIGSAAAPGLAITGSASTGLFSPGANSVAVTANGTEVVRCSGVAATVALDLNVSGQTTVSAGAVGAPGLRMAGSATTGIFAPAVNTIAVTAGGIEALRSTSAAVTVALPTSFTGAATVASGAVGAPGVRFANSATTGLYAPAAGTIAVTAGGVEAIRATSTLTTVSVPMTITGPNALTTTVLNGLSANITGIQLTPTGAAPFGSWTNASAITMQLRRLWTVDSTNSAYMLKINWTQTSNAPSIYGYALGAPFAGYGGCGGVLMVGSGFSPVGAMNEMANFTKFSPDFDTLASLTKSSNFSNGMTYVAIGVIVMCDGFD